MYAQKNYSISWSANLAAKYLKFYCKFHISSSIFTITFALADLVILFLILWLGLNKVDGRNLVLFKEIVKSFFLFVSVKD